MRRPASPEGYILSELEVYGRGGPVPKAKPAPGARPDGSLPLAGGAWRLQRDSLVAASGEELSKPGFHDQEWMIATVPGTVLTSYLNDGAVRTRTTAAISSRYRTRSSTPILVSRRVRIAAEGDGKHVWLNFNGINWKASVFLNGEKIGRIEGASCAADST